MTKANINSLKPYYVTKDGLVFNDKFEVVNLSYNKKYNLHILRYRNLENKQKQIPLTRLVYSSFYPERDLAKQTITRKRQDIELMYSLDNLSCISAQKMTKHNGLDKFKGNLKQGHPSFFESLTLLQRNTLTKILKNNEYSVKFLASKYGVSEMAIYRAKKKLVVI